MGQQRRLDRLSGAGSIPLFERGQAEQDPGGAEATLTCSGRHKGVDPTGLELRMQAFDRGDRAAGYPADGRDTGHASSTVDPHGATTALALGATSVFDGTAVQLLAQGVE
jgi:hypothetical protein